MPGAQDGDRRRAELVTALGGVRARVAAACERAGRDARGVTLIAVTKTYPVGDVVALAELGLLDIGESKDQEARAKVGELAEAGGERLGIRWHLIGRLQTNKARSVVAYAHAVHTVDRPKLARALADAWPSHRADPLDVFVQISLDGDPDRGGVPADRFDELVEGIAQRPQLRLRGVMAVPPLGSDADHEFERLQGISTRLREQHPDADAISAGMSSDLEAAIRHGSTHVRVGTALLGRREQVFG